MKLKGKKMKIKICLRGLKDCKLIRTTQKNLATLKKYLATLKRVSTPSLRTAVLRHCQSNKSNKQTTSMKTMIRCSRPFVLENLPSQFSKRIVHRN